MSDLTTKIWLAVRWALAIIGILGISSAGLQIWLLTEVVGNGKRIEIVRGDLITRISDTTTVVTDQITEVSGKLSALKAVLGESPERIQKAALQVEGAASTIAELQLAAKRIVKFDSELESMKKDVSQIRMDIEEIKIYLDVRKK